MPPFAALFQLITSSLAWALLCFAIYIPLRLLGRWVPLAATCLGLLSLLVWLAGLCLASCFVGFDEHASPYDSHPYPFGLLALLWGNWIALMLVGTIIIGHAAQKEWRWGRSFLFCALYLLLCYAPLYLLPAHLNPGANWDGFWRLAGMPVNSPSWNYILECSLWAFPLGVPIAETAFRSLRTLLQSNKSGSFT